MENNLNVAAEKEDFVNNNWIFFSNNHDYAGGLTHFVSHDP